MDRVELVLRIGRIRIVFHFRSGFVRYGSASVGAQRDPVHEVSGLPGKRSGVFYGIRYKIFVVELVVDNCFAVRFGSLVDDRLDTLAESDRNRIVGKISFSVIGIVG